MDKLDSARKRLLESYKEVANGEIFTSFNCHFLAIYVLFLRQ